MTTYFGTALILTDGQLLNPHGKTAHGLLRTTQRFTILGVIDDVYHGSSTDQVLKDISISVPIFASLEEALAKLQQPPEYVIIGVANAGGVMPTTVYRILQQALRRGISVVNGLHDLVSSNPILSELSQTYGGSLIDIRKPKHLSKLHFWTGQIQYLTIPRIAILGTDCGIGKRTTTQFIKQACQQRGLEAAMIYTGQTGWMQGEPYGVILDSTPNDFISGELEHAVLSCAAQLHPDVILLEGQSSLFNPSGPCGSEFLLSAQARYVILQHAPHRQHFLSFPEFPIPPLEKFMDLIEQYGAKVIAITLNGEGATQDNLIKAQHQLQSQWSIPVVLPLEEGVERIVDAIQLIEK